MSSATDDTTLDDPWEDLANAERVRLEAAQDFLEKVMNISGYIEEGSVLDPQAPADTAEEHVATKDDYVIDASGRMVPKPKGYDEGLFHA